MKASYTILTLDAGGTNFVFSAISNDVEVAETITLPANANSLEGCLSNLFEGFRQLKEQVGHVDAISFAFPGPADYTQGIIGNLPNFEAFTKPIPLADILQNEFKVPVFINNDANLFTSGEAQAGFLPAINKKLLEAGSNKQYHNLIGITLGTGFGCGIVSSGHLLVGDNSSGGEIHNTVNKFHPTWRAEEDVSTRALQRFYQEESCTNHAHTPKEIYQIAHGNAEGDQKAALRTFQIFGQSLGASLVNVLTLIDGLIVIGGGLSGAWDLFSDHMFKEINGSYSDTAGKQYSRLSFEVFNLEDPLTFGKFAEGNPMKIQVPASDISRVYDALPRTGIGISSLGVSRATTIGAYSFAINKLNKQ